MKWRLWLKITIGILAMVVVLIFANGVIDSQRARVSQAQDREGNRNRDSFAPQELYKAASPFAGLMESIRPIPDSRVSMKSVGLSLLESSDKTDAVVQQPASSPLKLIRTSQVSIEVPDYEKAAKDLGKVIESLGGYIADTQVHRNPSGTRSGTISSLRLL
ncbi:MAG: DUF4349 domain-containing protein [Holophagaceae bacterium]|uniref:DUF4349 domain-containing protein n=1 Tax=Candidatus Geothrix odensensis TaxID=2954440 RepID=A0A936K7E3_9BACT|nr:DUF4349 domain-containing protein [Candidatus Geothrix odensensis]